MFATEIIGEGVAFFTQGSELGAALGDDVVFVVRGGGGVVGGVHGARIVFGAFRSRSMLVKRDADRGESQLLRGVALRAISGDEGDGG